MGRRAPGLALAAVALAIAMATAIAAAAGTGGWGPVEMSPSVMVVGDYDYLPYQRQPPFVSSRCTDMVNRAVQRARPTTINFYPTLYWRGGSDGGVDSYCYTTGEGSSRYCTSWDEAAVSAFRSGMELCFRRAVELGLAISVVPHLDDGGGSGSWRNGLVFDPTAKHQGYSYADILLYPLADALAAAIASAPGWSPRTTTPVWLALQGEMSATVMRHPGAYRRLADELRARVLAGMAARGLPADLLQSKEVRTSLRLGVSLNYNKVFAVNGATSGGAGGGGPAGGSAGRLLGRGLLATSPAAPPGINVPAVTALMEAVDFVGISAYASLKQDFQLQDLQASAFTFFEEFKSGLGLDLWALMARRRIPLHFSEFGIGGGSSPGGYREARSPATAAAAPFYGVWGTYRPVIDPWNSKEMKDFLHSFYRRSLDWLAQGTGPTYPISHCFMWAMGSWDVLAIYPESTNSQGSFLDPAVRDMVKQHNGAVAAGVAAAASGGVDPSK